MCCLSVPFIFLSSVHTIPHNDKVKTVILTFLKKLKYNIYKYSDPLFSTLLKNRWQRLQHQVFLGMTLHACHTCIWGVSPILLCRSSQALSGWMGVFLHSYFHVSPEMCDRVQVWALAGPLNDIQRLVPKPLLRCLGCVLRVVVLLEGEPSPK